MRLAVLDANVLYPAHLRDVLLWLAVGGLYRPRWSDRIHDEWTRNLLAKRPDLTAAQLAYTRAEMKRAFPDADVAADLDREAAIALPDPDDRHVLATAIVSGASLIVTANLKDFPADALGPYGVDALHPDAFATGLLEADLEGALAVLREHRTGLRRPPLTPTEYVGHLERSGLLATGAVLKRRLRDLA